MVCLLLLLRRFLQCRPYVSSHLTVKVVLVLNYRYAMIIGFTLPCVVTCNIVLHIVCTCVLWEIRLLLTKVYRNVHGTVAAEVRHEVEVSVVVAACLLVCAAVPHQLMDLLYRCFALLLILLKLYHALVCAVVLRILALTNLLLGVLSVCDTLIWIFPH